MSPLECERVPLTEIEFLKSLGKIGTASDGLFGQLAVDATSDISHTFQTASGAAPETLRKVHLREAYYFVARYRSVDRAKKPRFRQLDHVAAQG
jgi:hypothetical protein